MPRTENPRLYAEKANKVYCSCGHSIILNNRKVEKVICSHCRRYVFIDKKVEFKERLKEQLRRRYEN